MPLCRAELRLEGPRGAWTARFASTIYDEPRALTGTRPACWSWPTGSTRSAWTSTTGEARWEHRSATPLIALFGSSRLAHVLVQSELETFAIEAGRDGRLADRPLRCRDRGRARRRPAGPDRLRRPGQRRRPGDGPRDRLTRRPAAGAHRHRRHHGCGRTVDNSPHGRRIWWTTAVDPAPPRRRSVRISPEGPSDTNGGDRINAHVSGRFLRAFSCPARIIAAVTPLVLILLGLALLGAGFLVLRSFGPRYRVGRLLAATPSVSDRRGARARPTVRRATSGSPAASTPRTSSRTTPTGRSSCAAPGSSAASGSAWEVVDEHREAVAVRGPRRARRHRHRPRGPRRRPRRPPARIGRDGRRRPGPRPRGTCADDAGPPARRPRLVRGACDRARASRSGRPGRAAGHDGRSGPAAILTHARAGRRRCASWPRAASAARSWPRRPSSLGCAWR